MSADHIDTGGGPSAAIETALQRCATEPVHIPGAIQRFGVLLGFDPTLSQVRHVTANAETLLGRPVADCLAASPADLLGARLLQRIRRGLADREQLPGALTITRRVAAATGRLHLTAFRSADAVVVEIEPVAGSARYRWLSVVNDWAARLVLVPTEHALVDQLASALRAITGCDRALVYLFDERCNGKVVAESRNGRLPSLLDHHFPASDIPPQVRALYRRNPVRYIADAGAAPVPLLALEPGGAPLDMSLGTLRAVAPIHCEYMRNMGIGTSLSIAIHSDRGLWGIVACQSQAPLPLSPSARDSASMLTQVSAQRLFLLQAEANASFRQRVRVSQAVLAGSLQDRRTPSELVAEQAGTWRRLFEADSLAFVHLDEIVVDGAGPTRAQVAALADWLDREATDNGPWQTASLLEAGYPDAGGLVDCCCGVLATRLPIDRERQGWLMLFRGEQARTVRWAGNPDKLTTLDSEGLRLSPRRSFAEWIEEVRGRSLAWHAAAADALRELGDDLAVFASAHEIARLNDSLQREREALAEANRGLLQLATTDSLTGAMNRYQIERSAKVALANAERYGQAVSLLLLDIDHFKQINDSRGHDEGDRVLKALVRVLQETLREGDLLGRWGGEEFLILLPHTPLQGAVAFAGRLRTRVSQADFGLPVTLSIGVTESVRGDTLQSLLVRADGAMYEAKHSGRDRVCQARA